MDNVTLNSLRKDVRLLQNQFNLSESDAVKLAVEIWKAEQLESIGYFLRKDGEFQESMSQIANAINDKL